MTTWSSIAEVRKANRQLGHHWFDRDTMAFFASRVETGILGGRYFVSSEQYSEDTPRRYTVRAVNSDGSIDTLGWGKPTPEQAAAAPADPFGRYATLGEAVFAAGLLAGTWTAPAGGAAGVVDAARSRPRDEVQP